MRCLLTAPMAFDIGTLLSNSFGIAKEWGGWIMLITGAVLIVMAVFNTAKGLMSHGQSQVSWPKVILMFIFGGVIIAFSGGGAAFDGIGKYAQGMGKTIDSLGTTTILLRSMFG